MAVLIVPGEADVGQVRAGREAGELQVALGGPDTQALESADVGVQVRKDLLDRCVAVGGAGFR